MGPLEPRTDIARAAGAALFLAAVAVFVAFQEIGLRLRREEHRAWWAGNGRDLLNLAGLCAVAAALVVFGFRPAAAILCGGTLTLVLFGTSMWLETRPWRGRRALALLAGLVLALPLVVVPARLLAVVDGVVSRLFAP